MADMDARADPNYCLCPSTYDGRLTRTEYFRHFEAEVKNFNLHIKNSIDNKKGLIIPLCPIN